MAPSLEIQHLHQFSAWERNQNESASECMTSKNFWHCSVESRWHQCCYRRAAGRLICIPERSQNMSQLLFIARSYKIELKHILLCIIRVIKYTSTENINNGKTSWEKGSFQLAESSRNSKYYLMMDGCWNLQRTIPNPVPCFTRTTPTEDTSIQLYYHIFSSKQKI